MDVHIKPAISTGQFCLYPLSNTLIDNQTITCITYHPTESTSSWICLYASDYSNYLMSEIWLAEEDGRGW